MKKEVIAYTSPKSPISEIFRTLRTNIQFMNVKRKMQVLLVTSTSPSEGKSWISSNLAVTFAQAGKKVIIIDSDMRKGRQFAILGVAPRPGLSDFLSSESTDNDSVLNYIQATEIENLYVIPAGAVPPNPSELLVSTQMIDLLDQLKKICDIVIIDGTPSELVTDSVILSRLADSTIIVTAHKITKKDSLRKVIKNIQNVDGRIAGIIINKLPISTKRYGEKYYYYGDERRRTSRSEQPSKSKLRPIEPIIKNAGEDLNDTKTTNKTNSTIKSKNTSDEKNTQEISNEEKGDILNQINKYLEKEKKNNL